VTGPDDPTLSNAAETFLGGRIVARQPATGYRAAVDTVLLGAAIELRAGERAVELGCGSGAALLVAAARNPDATFVGVERDPALAALAEANARANASGPRVEIVAGDALTPPADWRDRFDQAFFNPPYYDDPEAMRPPRDPSRRAAFVAEEGGLAAWVAAALAVVRTRGRLTLIHRADRLADLLAALDGAAGEVRILPIRPRRDAPAHRILVRARKGAKTPLALLPGLALHEEGGGWTAEAAAILEGARGLAFEA
jgi:tRNA1(Val) A37 N6-methylase TrmN6